MLLATRVVPWDWQMTVALDVSKLSANASRHKAVSYRRMVLKIYELHTSGRSILQQAHVQSRWKNR